MSYRGALRLKLGQSELAEADFRDAITMAQRMNAKAWERRSSKGQKDRLPIDRAEWSPRFRFGRLVGIALPWDDWIRNIGLLAGRFDASVSKHEDFELLTQKLVSNAFKTVHSHTLMFFFAQRNFAVHLQFERIGERQNVAHKARA